MRKSDIQQMPEFFDRYIHLVEDIGVVEALEKHASVFEEEKEHLKELNDKRYAPGKWSARDILQHVIDTERIQAYRALRFSRNDQTVLPGFDEALFANHTNAGARTVENLLDELQTVRRSSIALFRSFDDEMLHRKGVCFKVDISVLALGFVIAGHSLHHLNILKERYYSLK